MDVNRFLRMIAGFFVLASLALGYWVSPKVVSLHRLRGTQSVPVGLYELVPDDDLPAQIGREAVRQ